MNAVCFVNGTFCFIWMCQVCCYMKWWMCFPSFLKYYLYKVFLSIKLCFSLVSGLSLSVLVWNKLNVYLICFTKIRLSFQRGIPSFSFYPHSLQFLCLFYPFPHKLNPPSSHNLTCWFSNVILIFLWLFSHFFVISWFTHPSYPIFYNPSPICYFFKWCLFDFCEIESNLKLIYHCDQLVWNQL